MASIKKNIIRFFVTYKIPFIIGGLLVIIIGGVLLLFTRGDKHSLDSKQNEALLKELKAARKSRLDLVSSRQEEEAATRAELQRIADEAAESARLEANGLKDFVPANAGETFKSLTTFNNDFSLCGSGTYSGELEMTNGTKIPVDVKVSSLAANELRALQELKDAPYISRAYGRAKKRNSPVLMWFNESDFIILEKAIYFEGVWPCQEEKFTYLNVVQ